MRKNIAVVGAGPAGLAAGIALHRLGFDAVLFEQAPQMEAVGGGILLHSNGLRALDALGVLPRLEPKLRFSGKMSLEAAGGHVLLSVSYADLPVSHPHCAVVLRYDLVDALLQTARENAVPLFLDRKFDGLTADENGVLLTLTSGATATETRRFDAVIACDGVHSPIRAALGLLPAGAEKPLPPWLRASTPVYTKSDTIREIWGDDGRGFGIMPLPGEETHFFCSAPPREAWDALLSNPAALRAWIESWQPFGVDVLEMVRAVPDWKTVHYGSPALVNAKKWHKGPVFLVGDAAHAMPPNLGQGANAALVDALVLARSFADVAQKDDAIDWEAAGRSYQAVRGPFMHKTQEAARELGFLSHQTVPLARLLRDEALRQSARIAPLRNRAVEIAIGHNPPEDAYLTALP